MKTLSYALVLTLLSAMILSCSAVGKAMQTSSIFASDPKIASALQKSGEAIGKAAEYITPEQEYYIGRAVGATILSKYKLYKDAPQLTAYLNKICAAITVNSEKPEIYNGYRVAILDSLEINAFATSGGHILITRGLLESAKSEDTLASVIAHEIAHIQLQHSLNAIKTSRITQAAAVTGLSAASAAGDGKDLGKLTDAFGGAIGDIVTTLVNNGYSRSQEFEADNKALSLLADAGYEPSSIVTMLKALQKNQAARSGGFNKTHPAPQDRIENVQKDLSKYPSVNTQSARTPRYNATLKK
ncbi:MAG: M48 family metalloprotease [Helicobacteraceae bacterium]|jgi:predicted Zn-dependent protease|nr:M48 family metalloprotease [Helicobacteraceae bacterium]